ncbi:MAG: hypothetical protein LBK82_07325 [Planctomycetaceae bacterium]|nr:hypothetical protein [Planctomycetaceae bacterium]
MLHYTKVFPTSLIKTYHRVPVNQVELEKVPDSTVGEKRWAIYQKARKAVAPVEFYSTPKRKATQFIVVNLIHCRLSPTQPFSK